MSQERTEALVLRAVDFSETSRIVTFLTPDRGKLACMAAGARRAKSPFGGALDTFNRLELVYYYKESRSVQKLGEASLLDAFQGLKSDLDKSIYAAFPLEIAYRTAQVDEPSHELYAALVRGLDDMVRWSGDARVHTAWQVLHLMSAAGYQLDTGFESASGRSVGFSYAAGLVGAGELADRRLSAGACDALRDMAASRATCPTVSEGGEIFSALREFVVCQLEADFKSLRVIERMFGRDN